MKRFTTILLSLTFAATTLFANPIDPEKAGAIAKDFWSTELRQPITEPLTLESPSVMAKAGSRINITENNPQYYIYTPTDNSGFVIVSGDDELAPIVGYSTDIFNKNSEMPAALVEWLNEYSQYVDDVRTGKVAPAQRSAKAGKSAITPMLQTTWDQLSPYNNLCPEVNGQKAPTGCTATAMAQIMKFHEWPRKPSANITWYNDITGKEEYINTYSHIYGWDKMLPHYRNGYTTEQAQEVAQLMVDVGKAIQSSYSLSGTGSNEYYAANALVNIFNYSKAVQVIKRIDSTEDEYLTVIRENLEARQPVLYVGRGINYEGGHAFVCDGIDENDMLHIDWGWSGAYNGYFDMTYMMPDGIGTGGGAGTYNVSQAIIVNITPRGENEVDGAAPSLIEFGIYKPGENEVKVNEYTANYSSNTAKFKVSTFVNNRSYKTFTDLEFGLAAKKNDGTYRILSSTTFNGNLNSGYYVKNYFDFTIDVANKNHYNYFAKGTHELKVVYKKNGEYTEVVGNLNTLILDVNDKSATLRHALPDMHVSSVEFTTSKPRIGGRIKFNAKFRNDNTYNSEVLVVPVVNTTLSNGSVVRDTLKNAKKMFEVLDNREIYVEFNTTNQFYQTGDCYITFAYNLSSDNSYSMTFDSKIAKSVKGKSHTFTIKEEEPGGIPTITSMQAFDITNGKTMDITTILTNQTYAGYSYSGELALVLRNIDTNQTYTVAESKVTDLGKNKSVNLKYKSIDYFPILPAGGYEVMVCEVKDNRMERIPETVKCTFNIIEGTDAIPYINGKTSVCDTQVVAGDSVDVNLTLGSHNGTFNGYVRINTSNGLIPILRSDHVPVTIAEGEKLSLDIACICGNKATMGQWTFVVKYFDKNKRELGTLSNNTLTYSKNGYFWVGDDTGIERTESMGNAKVTVYENCINITGTENIRVTVYSADGREIYHGTDSTVQVAGGLYIVTVQQQDGTTTTTKVLVK